MAEAHFFHTGSRRSLPDFHQVGKRKAEESPAVFSGGSRVQGGAAFF
jgi:hypothetical protein